MANPKRNELRVRAETAFLVHVGNYRDHYSKDDPLVELRDLVKTAQAKTVGEMIQYRNRMHPNHYVGKGKLEELCEKCKAMQIDVVICDDDLSPSQVRNMEEALDTKVVDRSEVILDIFASHARTAQAQLAVELAQLEYTLPRLKQMWTHLDRTAGGTLGGPVGGGIGVRGTGEKQLEVDRRLVERRIYELRQNLKEIEKRCEQMVKRRKEQFPTVSLVGYTNAGKSSLLNALTNAGVSVRDNLFVTLDTRTRAWRLKDGRQVLISDTVGFIRKLPHHLVASFQATLEDARHADLLIHVADCSNPMVMAQIRSVQNVLRQIKCENVDTLLVLNKEDVLDDSAMLPLIKHEFGDYILASAHTGKGLDELDSAVADFLSARQVKLDIETDAGNGRLVSFLYEHGSVLRKDYHDNKILLQVRIPPNFVGPVSGMGGIITAKQ